MALKIAIGGDHAGFQLKEIIKSKLESEGYFLEDFGPFSDQSVDYPDFVHPVANSVENGEYNFGILICGSGNGVAMTANKHKGIRAAVCWNEMLAKLARAHNDANILCLAGRFLDDELAMEIVDTFLKTDFDGGRHIKRIKKIIDF
ncbi:MAG: ribose 5-phosphate isomerase B [Cyclobacteriaceae bacterium]|jgi:ribose 5-phosphate isomerase B